MGGNFPMVKSYWWFVRLCHPASAKISRLASSPPRKRWRVSFDPLFPCDPTWDGACHGCCNLPPHAKRPAHPSRIPMRAPGARACRGEPLPHRAISRSRLRSRPRRIVRALPPRRLCARIRVPRDRSVASPTAGDGGTDRRWRCVPRRISSLGRLPQQALHRENHRHRIRPQGPSIPTSRLQPDSLHRQEPRGEHLRRAHAEEAYPAAVGRVVEAGLPLRGRAEHAPPCARQDRFGKDDEHPLAAGAAGRARGPRRARHRCKGLDRERLDDAEYRQRLRPPR